MSGILYVVATPIGNLEDVTLRALRILREVSLIAAEDTRHTTKLLQHYSISTPATSLHEHNEHLKTPRLVERLEQGESIALVSDAGTPAVSDPGARLVAAAHRNGIVVQPVPGPSAVTAIVSAAGIGSDGFTFVGFPPNRSSARKRWLTHLEGHEFALVMYEAPHRILATIADIQSQMGERRVAIGRELTKVHEFLAVRPISEWVASPPPAQGEFALVVFPSPEAPCRAVAVEPAVLAQVFWQLTDAGRLGRREALRQVARQFNVSTKAVFAAVEAYPKSGN
jgi:16S rRNA (cytidine1402-2'-O)-methyltransferase